MVRGRIAERLTGVSVVVAASGDSIRTFTMAEVDSIVTTRRLWPAVARPARAFRPRSIALGLSAGYSHGRSELGSTTTGSSEEAGISTSVAYFVMPGLALGVGAGVSHATAHSTYAEAPAHGTTVAQSTTWGIGPYVVYYLGGGRPTSRVAGSLYPYVAAGVHFGGGSDSTDAEYYSPTYGYVDFYSSSFSGHSDFVEAGLLCMVAEWAAVAVSVEYSDESSRERSASMTSIEPQTLHASHRYLDVQLGLRWFLY